MARVKIKLHEPPAKPGNSAILQIIKYKISKCLCAPQNHPVVLGVADADVVRDALCESYARPVAKHGRHVGTTMCFRFSWDDKNFGNSRDALSLSEGKGGEKKRRARRTLELVRSTVKTINLHLHLGFLVCPRVHRDDTRLGQTLGSSSLNGRRRHFQPFPTPCFPIFALEKFQIMYREPGRSK